MPCLWLRNPGADARAGGQRAVHPAQAGLFDFDPAFTDGRQAALLESLAAALGVEQGKVAMAGVGKEQRFEKAHGCVPGSLHAAKVGSLA